MYCIRQENNVSPVEEEKMLLTTQTVNNASGQFESNHSNLSGRSFATKCIIKYGISYPIYISIEL